METRDIHVFDPNRRFLQIQRSTETKKNGSFKAIYDEQISTVPIIRPETDISLGQTPGDGMRQERSIGPLSEKTDVWAPRDRGSQYRRSNTLSDLKKYKDDQLLSNPGGDHYYLSEKKYVPEPQDQRSFAGRLGKDISDAFGNIKNFFGNLLFGSKVHFRDKNDEIQEARQRGLVGSVVDFFKDLGSALSFGKWRPDNEEEPVGFGKRCGFFFSKMKEALFGDLIQGVSGSVVHMGEDLLFAGWNLIETVPDATIGNFETGRKVTTAVFDYGQVAMDYLTDIAPSGDAWVRVHSMKFKDMQPPVLNNIKMPEHNEEDSRWKYVRNTPFRKAIETVGSLISDVLTLRIFGQLKFSSEKRHHKN